MTAWPKDVRKILVRHGFRPERFWREGFRLLDLDGQIAVHALSPEQATQMQGALEQEGFGVHRSGHMALVAERD